MLLILLMILQVIEEGNLDEVEIVKQKLKKFKKRKLEKDEELKFKKKRGRFLVEKFLFNFRKLIFIMKKILDVVFNYKDRQVLFVIVVF